MGEYKSLAPGVTLLNRVIDGLAEEGVPLLDLGWGDSTYKQLLSSHRHDVLDLRFYANRLLPRLALQLDEALKATDQTARQLLASGGKLHRLRKFWRERLLTRRAAGAAAPAPSETKTSAKTVGACKQLPSVWLIGLAEAQQPLELIHALGVVL